MTILLPQLLLDIKCENVGESGKGNLVLPEDLIEPVSLLPQALFLTYILVFCFLLIDQVLCFLAS